MPTLFAASSFTPLNILPHHLTTLAICFGKLLQPTGFVNPSCQVACLKPLIVLIFSSSEMCCHSCHLVPMLPRRLPQNQNCRATGKLYKKKEAKWVKRPQLVLHKYEFILKNRYYQWLICTSFHINYWELLGCEALNCCSTCLSRQKLTFLLILTKLCLTILQRKCKCVHDNCNAPNL